jgi:hypothetical protein
VAEALPFFLGPKWSSALLDCTPSFHNQLCLFIVFCHMVLVFQSAIKSASSIENCVISMFLIVRYLLDLRYRRTNYIVGRTIRVQAFVCGMNHYQLVT